MYHCIFTIYLASYLRHTYHIYYQTFTTDVYIYMEIYTKYNFMFTINNNNWILSTFYFILQRGIFDKSFEMNAITEFTSFWVGIMQLSTTFAGTNLPWRTAMAMVLDFGDQFGHGFRTIFPVSTIMFGGSINFSHNHVKLLIFHCSIKKCGSSWWFQPI